MGASYTKGAGKGAKGAGHVKRLPALPINIIKELLVKTKQKGAILELKRRHLKKTVNCYNTPYPAKKIRRISASSSQETRNDQFPIRRITLHQYAVCTAVHQSKIHN
ncbi:hypothetical protein Tco_1077082 [Tanacetum coccineum]